MTFDPSHGYVRQYLGDDYQSKGEQLLNLQISNAVALINELKTLMNELLLAHGKNPTLRIGWWYYWYWVFRNMSKQFQSLASCHVAMVGESQLLSSIVTPSPLQSKRHGKHLDNLFMFQFPLSKVQEETHARFCSLYIRNITRWISIEALSPPCLFFGYYFCFGLNISS